MKIVKFPESNLQCIPDALRKLTDQIEAGDYNEAHQLAWIIDCGDSRIEYGLLGKAGSAGAEFNLLLDMAKFRMCRKV